MRTRPTVWQRLPELLPVWGALGVYAVAHGRWLLSGPLMAALLGVAFLRWVPTHSPLRFLGAGVLGLAAGALLLFAVELPPDSPIPPQVLSPLCGALAGFTALCALTRRLLFAWIYAGLLTVLSLEVPVTGPLLIALAGLALSLMLLAFVNGGLATTGLRGAVAFAVFTLGVGGLSVLMTRGIHSMEGTLMGVFYELTRDRPQGSARSGRDMSLPRSSSVRGGTRLLMELAGNRPPHYLREGVLDSFDGYRWRTSLALDRQRLELSGLPPPKVPSALEVFVPSPGFETLPAPAGTRQVEGGLQRAEGRGGWLISIGFPEGRTLHLQGDVEERLPPEALPDASLTALPDELRDELQPLARSLVGTARTPREVAEALELHFQTKHQYSLKVDLSGTGSPLAVLIRERRPAYCQYFASAMAALMRSLDLPARVVVGFVPQEQNALTGRTVVRDRDAHAWVEVYLADEGRFVTFDPTPWASREASLEQDAARPGWLGQTWDAAFSVGRRWWAAALLDPSRTLWNVVKSPLFFIPAFALLAWRSFRRRRVQRAQRLRAAMESGDPAARAVYGQYLKVLARAGFFPMPSETDDELLVRLHALRGAQVEGLARDFLQGYREVRYRGVPAETAPLRERVAALETALRRPSKP